MKPLFLLVHGWGFDAAFWDRLGAYLPPEDVLVWDLGFFGPSIYPAPQAGRPVVAVGHSFGLLWLLHECPLPWRALVGINGFSCFAQRPDFAQGQASRVLTRMRRRLETAPGEVLALFHHLCGSAGPPQAAPTLARLAAGLEGLAAWDKRDCAVDLALCGAADPLVTPAMSQALFESARTLWHPGGHLLPLEAPVWCAEQLTSFAARLA